MNITIEVPDSEKPKLEAIEDGAKVCLNVTVSGGVYTLDSVEPEEEEAAEETPKENPTAETDGEEVSSPVAAMIAKKK